jgi:hypothetical protein
MPYLILVILMNFMSVRSYNICAYIYVYIFVQKTINVSAHEHVNKINGTIGPGPDGDDAITSLTFTTSAGAAITYGDPNNGSDFTVPLANAGIYAFFGRSGNYLNALGFYAHTQIHLSIV